MNPSDLKVTIKVDGKPLPLSGPVKFDYQSSPSTSEEIERLRKAFGNLAQAAQTLGTGIITAFGGASEVSEVFEDALRPNAYHPKGPVVHSTAEVLPLEEGKANGSNEN